MSDPYGWSVGHSYLFRDNLHVIDSVNYFAFPVREHRESFLMSFYNEQLRVKVQGREINKKSLPGYMERVHRERPGATKGTYGNYLALT